MSPLAIWNHIPTVLDLNGPSLEFSTQPVGVTTTVGLAVTFTGVATVSFPAGTAIEGNIVYRWYNSTDGSAITDGNRTNSRGGITTFSGAATTSMIIMNCQFYEDNADEYYLEADFKPVGYWQPGNESPNPNAINDKLKSNTVQLLVPSVLEIVSQPQPETEANTALLANFNVVATLTDPSLNALIEYQWKIDGANLVDDGTNIIGATSPNLRIKRSEGSYQLSCSVSHPDALPTSILSDTVAYITSPLVATIYAQYLDLEQEWGNISNTLSNREADLGLGPLNLTAEESTVLDLSRSQDSDVIQIYSPDSAVTVLVEAAAAGGSSYSGNRGGRGGWGLFKLTIAAGTEYSLKLGSFDRDYAPYGGGISGQVRGTYGGGGVFLYRGNRNILTLGGGGGAGESGRGGDGGGPNQDGEDGRGRGAGEGGVGNPTGRGQDNFTADREGHATASCPSPNGDRFRENEGLNDCQLYESDMYYDGGASTRDVLTGYRKAVGSTPWGVRGSSDTMGSSSGARQVPNTPQLRRGWRNGAAGRNNGGWAINGAGGAGGSGAHGGNGASSGGSGGGGASGYADAGNLEILDGRTGVNAGDAFVRISLFDENAPLPQPEEVTPENFVSIEWDNSTALGYRTGDPDNIGGSDQTVDGTIIYGPTGNINTGLTTSPPVDYAPMYSGYRGGAYGNGIYFNPSDYVDSDNRTRAFGISYIDFELFIQDYGPVGGDNNSYLTSNLANRDYDLGTVGKWWTQDTGLRSQPNLYTNDKNEAFVPCRVEFEVAFACAAGGNYRVLYMTKSYDWTTFGQTHDVLLTSADLATQNGLTPSGNKLIFPDYSQYNYEDPRIVYIRSRILDLQLDGDNVNTLNMYSVASSNTTTTGTGNYLEFGRYLDDGQVPTGISPTVIPPPENAVISISVSRSAADSNKVTYTKQNSGTGPHAFEFGPNGGDGAGEYTIQRGTTYRMTARAYSGGRGLIFRKSGNSIQFDDVGDSDYNDLVVSFSSNVTINDDGGSWTVNEN